MGLLSSIKRKHLDGHKHLTSHGEVVTIPNEYVENVYIPVVANNATPFDVLVKEGDQVKEGTKVALRKDLYVPIYSSVSGVVVGFEDRYHAGAGRPVKHLVIKNDFKYEKELLTKLPLKHGSEEIINAIKEAGIVGLGGAGFPTFMKYSGAKGITTILINGVECEPYLTTDYFTMQSDRDLMFKGIRLLMDAAGASEAIIAIKKGKKNLEAKILETINNYQGITLKLVPDVYPMGWERTLFQQIFKKDYEKFPSEHGVIVNNAQTAIAVARALQEGLPITNRLITVAGDGVAKNINVLVPVGTPVENIIKFAGGYTDENIYLLNGGPMTSKGMMNDKFVIGSCAGGLTVLKRVNLVAEQCLRCGACTDHCPVGLQPVEIKIAVESKNNERLEKLETNKCVECGLCSYICPSHIEVTEFVKKGKLALKLAAAKAAAAKK